MSEARRLYAAALPDEGGEVRLDAVATRHAKVLRLREGDPLVLFDGRGAEADAVLERLGDLLLCRAERPRLVARPGPTVVLCQCLPKGGKLDDIVRAATELGVTAVHLVSSDRSVPRLDPARADKRSARLAKVAREASRQSRRNDVPDVLAPASLDEVLARAPEDAARIAFAPGTRKSLEEACGARSAAWILVGPEGGLSDGELDLVRQSGFALVDLGPGVLRVETAAPVAVALVTHRLGGLRARS